MLWQIFIGHRSAWFPLLSACRQVELSCVLCIVKAHFYRKIYFEISTNLLSSTLVPEVFLDFSLLELREPRSGDR